MADSPNTPIQPGKKEMSMEVRLVLAFVLMGLVLFITPYVYKAPPQPAKPAAAAATPAARPPSTTPAPGAIRAQSEQEFVVETQIYRIRLTNHGGAIQSWELKKYLDHSGKPLDLVHAAALAKVPPPFSLSMKDAQEANALNYAYYVGTPDPDGLGIQYEFSDGINYAKKTFHFTRDGYLSQVATEVTRNGSPVDHLIEWRGGFGDATVLDRATAQHAIYYDLGQGKLITKDAKSVKDGPMTAAGN